MVVVVVVVVMVVMMMMMMMMDEKTCAILEICDVINYRYLFQERMDV